MKFVYGLGNPGTQYTHTRHNIGFMVVDRLCRRWNMDLCTRNSDLVSVTGEMDGETLVLAKPLTYMNLSGEPLGKRGIMPEDLLVVYDDMDLPLGSIRVRPRGSAGGHRGLGSIIENLDSSDFIRVRCGIGRPVPGQDPRDFVLGGFGPEDQKILDEEIELACDAVELILRDGVEKAMNVCNRRTKMNG